MATGRHWLIAATLIGWSFVPAAGSVTVSFGTDKDNTLYESEAGTISNGAGMHMFTGRSGTGFFQIRRALVAFDILRHIPDRATIDSVELRLNMSRARFPGDRDTSLHRVLADWGEGASNAGGQEGGGAVAASGDATWFHTFFDTEEWAEVGGDFAPSASDTVAVNEIGSYTWGSTASMVADVQAWLDNPGSNFGWIVIGDESQNATARRFDTHENPTVANRPVLTVTFTAFVCPDECCDNATCDDGKTCTEDLCLAGICQHLPGATGTSCRQSTGPCDPVENCDGLSENCPPDLFAPNGNTCDDGLFCTTADACTDGVCAGLSTCDDGLSCTLDSCDEGANLCTNAPDIAVCDDSNACTVDTCDTVTGCDNDGTGVTIDCDDGDPCSTADACQGDAAGTCSGVDADVCQPATPAAPHNIPKNRFVSIDPSNPDAVSLRVELLDLACNVSGKKCNRDADCKACVGGENAGNGCSIDSDCAEGTCVLSGETCDEQNPPVLLGWVSDPEEAGGDALPGTFTSDVVATQPAARFWTESVVHIGACEIAPVRTYAISATADGAVFSDPLVVATIEQPQGKFWGDIVGSFDGIAWSAPNGLVGVSDVQAMIKFLSLKPAPHITVVDLVGSSPTFVNTDVTATDLLILIKAFLADPFPPVVLVKGGYPANGDVTQCP